MTNITLDGLPAKTGTVSDAGIVHYRESGVDKKMTIADLLAKITSQYQSFMQTFLVTADKAAARAALDIARRTAVNNADYTILVTDKVVAQTGTMSAARTFTLPAASAYPAGEELTIVDQSYTVNKIFHITISRSGSDTFNNGYTSIAINNAGGILKLVSDGSSKWTILQYDNPLALESYSNRNVLINGAMNIDQRNVGAAQTITAAAALAYTIDQWYAYCTGANVTGQRVAGTAPNQYNYRFTGAASVTKIGFAQRIEAANSQHLAGEIATLSVDLANSLLTTVTWVVYYANSADTFGTLASPTRTQIATGTFTVSSTLTRFTTNITIPSAATTGIEIEFSVAAQTSGTWTIGRAQLESGIAASRFDQRQIAKELFLCQRYYQKSYDYTTLPGTSTTSGAYSYRAVETVFDLTIPLKAIMRGTPTITTRNPVGGTVGEIRNESIPSNITVSAEIVGDSAFSVRGASGVSNAQRVVMHWEVSAVL